MPDGDVIAMLTQFGTAGLVAWLWLSERRAAAAREQQLSEAHAKAMAQGQQIDVLVKALGETTRALTLVEAGQRELARVLERLAARPSGPSDEASRPRKAASGGGRRAA